MFVAADDFGSVYRRIKQSAKGECTVLILASLEVDSLCALRMITDLLKGDDIAFQYQPVNTYEQVMQARQLLVENQGQFKTVVMLNCGGNIDLLEAFEAGPGQENDGVVFYVIDSHRPLNLNNIYLDGGRVLLFDDGTAQRSVPPPDEVILSDSDDDEEEEEEDEGLDDEERYERRKRRKLERRGEDVATRRHRRELAKQRQKEYYAGSTYGMAASVCLWQLVNDLGRGCNRLLWYATVGLTDHYLQDKVTTTTYNSNAERLRSDVNRLNADDTDGQAETRQLRLACIPELKLFLYRHWNFFDAMKHSRFVASRIEVWRRQGVDKIRNIFATMGISNDLCQSNYASLEKSVRDTIVDQLPDVARQQDIDDIVFPSFTFQQGYEQEISATDVVHVVSAVLNDDVAMSLSASSPRTLQEASDAVDQDVPWKRRFYLGLDVLSMADRKLFRAGVDLAMKQAELLLAQVENVMENKDIVTPGKHFRTITLEDASSTHFSNTHFLRNLSVWVRDIFSFGPKPYRRKSRRPLLFAALNAQEETYTVLGMWCLPKAQMFDVLEEQPLNRFGFLLRHVAAQTKLPHRADGFDTSHIELAKDSLNQLVMMLNVMMKAEAQ